MKKLSLLILILFTSFSVFAQSRSVSITFDDLPATSANANELEIITEKLTTVFKEYDLPVIGFVNEGKLDIRGRTLQERVDLLEAWLEVGADLGNHTYSHVFIDRTTIDDYKRDVLRGERVIRPLMEKYGKTLKYFRHPQLRTGPTDAYRNELNSFLTTQEYTIAPVTIDNDEYVYAFCYAQAARNDDEEIMRWIQDDYLRYMNEVFAFYEKQSVEFLGYEPKQTLLLHANLLNADVFEDLVLMIQDRGYEFISLEEALKDEAYQREEVQSDRGLSWLHRWMLADGVQPQNHPEVSETINQLFTKYRSSR